MTDRVQAIRPVNLGRLMESYETAARACSLLKAMSNEWRLMILCLLTEGSMTVSQLQRELGISQSALSQHLAVLRRERLVQSSKRAQSVSYSLTGGAATAVMKVLHDVFCGRTE